MIVNLFESILTCVPIRSFLHGLAAKAASPVLLATPAGVISRLRRSMSFASQMFSLYHKWFSTSKLVPPHFCYILPASSACWSSPHPISNSQLHVLPHFHLCPIYLVVFKGVYFIRMGYLILRGASRLDAFSVYPFRTWLPGHGFGKPTGPPAVRPSRSSRTKDSSYQISSACAG